MSLSPCTVRAVDDIGRSSAQLELVSVLENHPIGEIDGLHDRPDLVIAVTATAQHLEREIDLSRGTELEATGAPRPRRQSTKR